VYFAMVWTPKEQADCHKFCRSEIKITLEMIEAGECELYQDDITESKGEWAARVFRAMWRARNTD
jgi:hypothetical protein